MSRGTAIIFSFHIFHLLFCILWTHTPISHCIWVHSAVVLRCVYCAGNIESDFQQSILMYKIHMENTVVFIFKLQLLLRAPPVFLLLLNDSDDFFFFRSRSSFFSFLILIRVYKDTHYRLSGHEKRGNMYTVLLYTPHHIGINCEWFAFFRSFVFYIFFVPFFRFVIVVAVKLCACVYLSHQF